MRVDIEDQAKSAGISDAQFDRWLEQQGGQAVSKELWEKLAESGIFPELPPRDTKTRVFGDLPPASIDLLIRSAEYSAS